MLEFFRKTFTYQPPEVEEESVEKSKAVTIKTHTRKIGDLPFRLQVILFITLAMQHLNLVTAEETWNTFVYTATDPKTNKNISFGMVFDRSTFTNMNETTQEILKQCGHLIQSITPADWSAPNKFWVAIEKFCADMIRSQAKAYDTRSLFDSGDYTISDDLWDCLHNTIDPSCKTDFWTDYSRWAQVLIVLAGICTVGALGGAAVKTLKNYCTYRSKEGDIEKNTLKTRPSINGDAETPKPSKQKETSPLLNNTEKKAGDKITKEKDKNKTDKQEVEEVKPAGHEYSLK